MNPVFGFLLVLVAALWVFGCFNKPNTLVTSRVGDHVLRLSDQTRMVSIGDRSHSPVLTFDGRLVSDSNPGFGFLTIQPSDYLLKTYNPDQPGPSKPDITKTAWTVYVSPGQFSRVEFDQIVACFEASRSDFDAGMDQFGNTLPGYSWVGRIGRIVYGEAPKPLVFKPKQLRYKPLYDDQTIMEETLTIRPDGEWELQRSATDGKGHSSGGPVGHGTVKLVGTALHFTEPIKLDKEEAFMRPDMIHLSDMDYLRSFADSTGRSLFSVVLYDF